jgi:hypothetical protein
MVTKMKTNKLALIIDCGVDDFLIESKLHRRLVYEKWHMIIQNVLEHIPGNIGKMPCLITFIFLVKYLKVMT